MDQDVTFYSVARKVGISNESILVKGIQVSEFLKKIWLISCNFLVLKEKVIVTETHFYGH